MRELGFSVSHVCNGCNPGVISGGIDQVVNESHSLAHVLSDGDDVDGDDDDDDDDDEVRLFAFELGMAPK